MITSHPTGTANANGIVLRKPSLVAISENVQKNNIKSFNKCSKQTRYIANGIELSKFDRLNVSSNRANWNLDEKDIL
jgi:hypothetical protein